MIEVQLNEFELAAGAQTGVRRQIEALFMGLPDKHGFEGLGWDVHVEGALGELAFAKAFGRYPGFTVNTYRDGGDVGPYEVRTRSKHHYDLLIRPNDKDGSYYVLVTGVAPTYRIHGYVLGGDAKRPEWLHGYGGRPEAYFVPKESLIPIQPKCTATSTS